MMPERKYPVSKDILPLIQMDYLMQYQLPQQMLPIEMELSK